MAPSRLLCCCASASSVGAKGSGVALLQILRVLRAARFVESAGADAQQLPAVAAGSELGGVAAGEGLALGGEKTGGFGDGFLAGHMFFPPELRIRHSGTTQRRTAYPWKGAAELER
jgi:hypothetical protein